jgi:uncharacterized protein YciI
MQPGQTFIVLSSAGPRRDLSKGTREQPYWDAHAAFIDRLVEAGFILLGGPLPDECGAFMVVRAASEEALRELLRNDPWYVHDVLRLVAVKRWEVFVDQWGTPTAAG